MFRAIWFVAIAALSLILLADVQSPAQQQKQNSTVAAVIKLADNLEAADVAAQAKKIVDDFDPCDISLVFTLKRGNRGGVGIGSAVKAGHRDAIDVLVKNWAGPKPPTKEELQTHQADLLKAARVVQAMAELAPFRETIYVPKNNDKKIEEWRRVSADFKSVSRAFHDSIKKGDPVEVRKAAINLDRTCLACHAVAGI